MECQDVHRQTILTWILRTYSVVLYTEFICLRIGTRISVLLVGGGVRIRSKMLITRGDTQQIEIKRVIAPIPLPLFPMQQHCGTNLNTNNHVVSHKETMQLVHAFMAQLGEPSCEATPEIVVVSASTRAPESHCVLRIAVICTAAVPHSAFRTRPSHNVCQCCCRHGVKQCCFTVYCKGEVTDIHSRYSRYRYNTLALEKEFTGAIGGKIGRKEIDLGVDGGIFLIQILRIQNWKVRTKFIRLRIWIMT